MTDVSRSRFAVAVLSILSIGTAFRALPLWQSPLPFNPDGLMHARNAELTVATGHLPLSLNGIFADDLGFASFLAIIELVTGIGSLTVSQPVIAVVGALPALLAVVLARRLGLQLGWPVGTARGAGLIAGLLLATGGIYLYRSMPVDEQTPGLFLVPLALTAVVYGFWTDDHRWLWAALPVIVYTPPLHNLDSIILGLSLLALCGLALVQPNRHRTTTLGLALGAVGFWGYLVAYNAGITQFTATAPHQDDRVVTAPGLLVAWTILVICGVAWSQRLKLRAQRIAVLVPFGLLFTLLGINVVVPIFPGMPETGVIFFLTTLALLLPTALACWAYPVITRHAENHALLIGLLAGPLTLIGFAVSAGLTPVYFNTITRTHWFLYLPVIALSAVGAIYISKHWLEGRQVAQFALVGLLLVSVLAGVPIAFAELSVYSYQGITTTGEFAASTFAHERVPGAWASDDHFVRISGYHPTTGAGVVAPVYSWVHNASGPPDCPVLIEDTWTDVGAQFYPRPPATLSQDSLEHVDSSFHQVYHGGSVDRIRLFQPTGASTARGCTER